MIAKLNLVLHHLVPTLMPQRLKILNYILQNVAKAAILPVLNLLSKIHLLCFTFFRILKDNHNHICDSPRGVAAKVRENVV
jgi:hypothetical protein